MQTVRIKRVYEPVEGADGRRVLVDRLWPRGVSKERAAVDVWAKDAAPSTELRQWFHSDPTQWAEFRRRYLRELSARRVATDDLVSRLRAGEVLTLVFAAREEERNHAHVLAEYLRRRAGSRKPI